MRVHMCVCIGEVWEDRMDKTGKTEREALAGGEG